MRCRIGRIAVSVRDHRNGFDQVSYRPTSLFSLNREAVLARGPAPDQVERDALDQCHVARTIIWFFVLLCAHLRDEDLCSYYAAASTLWRRRSNPARPYMVRLMTFSRLICPSTGPVLQGSVKAACTASRSWRRLPAKPLKPPVSAAAIQPSSWSSKLRLIMVENALAKSTARAIGGDSSSSVVTNRPSSPLSLSGSLINRRAALRGVGGLGGLAGGARSAAGS